MISWLSGWLSGWDGPDQSSVDAPTTHVIVGQYLPEMLRVERLRIVGVGGIESEEAFGFPSIKVDQNELLLLLLAA